MGYSLQENIADLYHLEVDLNHARDTICHELKKLVPIKKAQEKLQDPQILGENQQTETLSLESPFKQMVLTNEIAMLGPIGHSTSALEIPQSRLI
ncbi:sensor histidine kinase [Sesbania bispinosa]|nr:sensor histidine kinase [Sesbania bispinosa]